VNVPNEAMKDELIRLATDGQSVDWYLQSLVSTVNTLETLEIGITLVVGGSVVSGRLVSGKKYFETFAKEFSDPWPGETKEQIRAAFARHADIYKIDEKGQENPPPPQFIHLIDARCFYPGSELPNNGGVLWRGKINAVSGFSLGALSTR
jgi:hypothetical protein